ncbi:hypothetical protein KUTeg_023337 [Tegillarca granosa]|uniref:Uncharacterized protein n=1 Tax=Tegillarca granosa TaxID=220873 RepID=A0ABQ9E6W1_TEGGR|nr:hypothetical protein KUTeg_023337 [Tegillarca granosa]
MDGKSLYPNVNENQDDIETDGSNIGTNLDSEAKVDLLRGTEKYHSNKEPDSNTKWGVAYYKQQQYADTPTDEVNPNESLAQDVSSTAVLTPLDDDLVGEIQEIEDRGNWSGRFDFLMSLLGYSVGLGNVWRFPYLAYSNGGGFDQKNVQLLRIQNIEIFNPLQNLLQPISDIPKCFHVTLFTILYLCTVTKFDNAIIGTMKTWCFGAFVFPFVLMLILIGIPLMFLELSFGQFAALGPAVIFDRFCPLFSDCYSYKEADVCNSINGSVFYNQTCFNSTMADIYDLHNLAKNMTKHAPAQDFFERGVLDVSEGIENMGNVQWKIALCLLLAWGLTFAALSKGVKSTGKVVYFTALFPYVVLTILFFRGITLPGAVDGIIFYLTPRFDKLGSAKISKEFEKKESFYFLVLKNKFCFQFLIFVINMKKTCIIVWSDAAAQIFFALSPAWGGLITLSSYNKFHNNCFKDSLIVSIGNICTSIFAGFVIFSIIGYLAKELEMEVDDVVEQGAGLAFIVYPDVVTRLPISPLWSILFFVMMITLGMGSEFALLETVMTAVQDTYPPFRKKKTWVVLCVSIIGFFGGLAVTTRGGLYLLQLMDSYVSSWSVFMMATLESVIVGWFYGAERFLQDIEMMIGQRSKIWHKFFAIFWKFISPLTLLSVLVFNLVQYKPLTLGDYVYPGWSNGLGWCLSLIPLILITSMSINKIMRAPDDLSFFQFVLLLLYYLL